METVLIVEDDWLAREVMTEMVQQLGYDAVPASNGQEALETIEDLLDQNRSFKLIFLDLEMPVMDGVTFRKKQLENRRMSQIPVVIVSGHRYPLPEEAMKNVERLPKPITFELMRRFLR